MVCLREADVNDLAAAGNKILATKLATVDSFAPILGGSFISQRAIDAFQNGTFAQVPLFFGLVCYFLLPYVHPLHVFSSNTNEGAGSSAIITAPWANTTSSNATQNTVYYFLKGQYDTLTNESFVKALELYPLADYGNSYDLQRRQMYGELRYICTAILINEAAQQSGLDAFQYR